MLAILTSPKVRQPRSNVPYHHCGRHGWMTVAQIARRTGLGAQTIRVRLSRGITGEALLAGKRGSVAPAKAALRNAVRLARAFPNKVPTTREIRQVVPLSEAQASRYRAALRETLDMTAHRYSEDDRG